MFKVSVKLNPNSRDFYRKHPDLASRNVYLNAGRVVDMKKIHKYIENFGKETFSDKCARYFTNLRNLFNKKTV